MAAAVFHRHHSQQYNQTLVIVGDEGVGKSSVLRCIQEQEGEDGLSGAKGQKESPAVDGFTTKNIKIDKKLIKLQIWNAQKAVDHIRSAESLYKDVNGVIVVYDVTNRESFENVKQKWMKEINNYASPTVAVMVLGNKRDCSSNRVVSTKEGQSCATKQGFQFMETSALNNENVGQAIERIVKIIIGPDNIKKNDFLKAVNKGEGLMTQLNIILHGPPGVGKTSLKQIILGLPPLPKHEQNSTDLMENAIRAIAIDRANSFKEISNEELIKLLAETLADQIHQFQAELSDDETTPVTPPSSQQPTGGWGSKFFKLLPGAWNAQPKEEEPDFDPAVSLVEHDSEDDFEVVDIKMTEAKNIRLLHDEIVFAKPSSSMFKSIWHHLIDSGGQPQFQDMLPSVFRSPSFQIVLMRLTEDLDEKPKMQYTKEGENVVEPKDLPLTNFQYIERACQIAASCDPPSKVMIVGTHKDQLGPDGNVVIATINARLFELYNRYDDVIELKSNDGIIFDMNTMADGNEREEYTRQLQKTISRVSSKWAKPKNVKLKWLCFHLAINKEEGGVVKYGDCLSVGKSFGMGSASVTTALKYFCDTGLLLYYPDEIPELVLTKINPLVDRLSGLIDASLRPPACLKNKCEKFKQRGTFNEAFINDLFPKTASESPLQSDAALDNKHFLKLLQYLKLAVKVDHKGDCDGAAEYFIPSALSFYSADRSVTLRYSESCGFALYLDNDKSILPHGLFFTTAVEFQSASSDASINLRIQALRRHSLYHSFKFELRKDGQQYRDRIQFHDKRNIITDVVILTDNKWWIQVTVANNSARPDPKNLKKIRSMVRVAIRKALNSRGKQHLYEIKKVFPCPGPADHDHENGHAADNPHHFCTLIKNKLQYKCSVNAEVSGHAGDQFHCWSGKSYNKSLSIPNLEEPPVNLTGTPARATPRFVWHADTPPTHKNVFDLLKPIAVNWKDIAREFEIGYNKSTEILHNQLLHTDADRLEDAINLWIEQKPLLVTWDNLHGILTKLKYQHIVENLVSQYAVQQQDPSSTSE